MPFFAQKLTGREAAELMKTGLEVISEANQPTDMLRERQAIRLHRDADARH
jgi:hypothetical protein